MNSKPFPDRAKPTAARFAKTRKGTHPIAKMARPIQLPKRPRQALFLALASLLSWPGFAPAACDCEALKAECAGGVYLDGMERQSGSAQFVFKISPCHQRAMAYVRASFLCDETCYSAFSFSNVTWRLITSSGGLKLTLPSNPQAQPFPQMLVDYVYIEPTNSLEDISPGRRRVVAKDGNGHERFADFDVQVECTQSTCTHGSCPVNLFGLTETQSGGVELQLKVGRYAFGKNAGSLSIRHETPTNILSTPAVLGYHWGTNTQCEVLWSASNHLRQVNAPEGLANVVSNSASKFYIDIYHPTNVGPKVGGFYQVTNQPMQTITVENPDGTGQTTNLLRITDGTGAVHDFEWRTNGWELTKGGGLRKEYRATTWAQSNTLRTITTEIRHNTNWLVSSHTRKYRAFSFGERLEEETLGTGSSTQTTSYVYYTNAAHLTGFVQQVTYGNGSWTSYQYDTNRLKTNVLMAFLNQGPTTDATQCRTTEYGYGTSAIPGAGDEGKSRPFEPRRIVEYLLGQEVSRRYVVPLRGYRRDIQCVSPGAAWDDTSNLVTATRWYTNGINAARLRSIERPDGTMDLYQYAFYTNGSGETIRTNIVLSGVPDTEKTNIVDGAKTITVLGPVGYLISRTVTDIASGLTTASETYSDYDGYNRPRKVTYLDGTWQWTEYGCCGGATVTNREGTVIYHYDDPLKRPAATVQNNITNRNVIDAAGNVLARIRIGTDGSAITQATNTYDTAGLLLASKDALGNTNTYAETITDGQLTRTTTYPDGSTRIETYYRDGQLAKISGTAVHPVRYTNGIEQVESVWREYREEIKLDGNGADTSERTKTYYDMLKHPFIVVYPGLATNRSYYNTKGQLAKQVDPDGVTTLYGYNARGELAYTAIDMNRNGVIDFTNGTDRIRQTIRVVTTNGNGSVQQTRSYVWATNNSAVSNLASVSEASTDGLKSWTSSFGVTNKGQTVYAGGGHRYATNTAPDGTFTISHFQDGRLVSAETRHAALGTLNSKTYAYDAHGRRQIMADARSGATVYAYDNADRVVSTTTPAPGTGQAPQTTSYQYDYAGRITKTSQPDGGSVTNEYYTTGELKKTSGARTYTVQYAYDTQGRKTNMTTWRKVGDDSTAAKTVWKYNERGSMTNKLYADGLGPSYAYSPAGRLQIRKWARGIYTTNTYNNAGDLVAVTYSDNATSNVTYNLDRQGRRTNILDGAGARYLTYTDTGLLVSETNASGTLAGMKLSCGYDQYLRRTNMTLNTQPSPLNYAYAYDFASRLTNVSDGTYSATYDSLANSPLIAQITLRSNSITRMTTVKQYDYLDRLLAISNLPSADTAMSYSYAYNHANQRSRCTMPDGSYWLYEYDVLGQLTSGKRYWPDGTPVAGQQYEYAYDDIGNRASTKQGGDESGGGLRLASYTANSLNQYTSRDVAGAGDLIGIAHASATVTVNTSNVYRHGEYYWKELGLNNSSAAVWQSVTNQAVLTNATNTAIGNLFLPKTPETFAHDADGNLTNDGRFAYTWDAENRLTKLESYTSAPTASKRRVAWAYDGQGRRIQQTTYDGSSGSYVTSEDLKLLYDGWQCLAELNTTNNNRLRSYLWGLDLSGTPTGAGGVGGLVAVNGAQNGGHLCAYDGNGNVVALAGGVDGRLGARYEYDPYGQSIRTTGPMAKDNSFKFSTKRCEQQSGALLYEYRPLATAAGRWLSRDALGEEGSLNLYAFLENDPLVSVDPLGLACYQLVRESGDSFEKWVTTSIWTSKKPLRDAHANFAIGASAENTLVKVYVDDHRPGFLPSDPRVSDCTLSASFSCNEAGNIVSSNHGFQKSIDNSGTTWTWVTGLGLFVHGGDGTAPRLTVEYGTAWAFSTTTPADVTIDQIGGLSVSASGDTLSEAKQKTAAYKCTPCPAK